MGETNGRTHEPNLRELIAELDGFRSLMDERDLRYDDRFRAQEKAVEKAEAGQSAYNERSNEFRAALDDAVSRAMPRPEVESALERLGARINEIKSELTLLRGRDEKGAGIREGAKERSNTIVIAIGLGATLLSIVATAIALLK